MFRNTLADLHNPSDDIVYGFTQPDGLQGTRQFHHWPRFGVDEDVLDIPLEDLGHEGRRRRSMYGKRRGFTPEERTKRVILCFIVVIVVIVLLVGGIFPAIFLSNYTNSAVLYSSLTDARIDE
ncbi:uncharacterized protein LOC119718866 [Patiria miniata]|uniref:Uncharacterized protein n=1 Tax=Patiria miniata TaxID=46514 RepID=A0A913YXF2_PATMI|nr:uncharacterized protein LOC119718866 [Patiria miniata]